MKSTKTTTVEITRTTKRSVKRDGVKRSKSESKTKRKTVVRERQDDKPALRFGRGNAKLGKHVYTFSLPAGYTCPGALTCLARADRATGRITDGEDATVRCFAASDERYPETRAMRWSNREALRGLTADEMSQQLADALPTDAPIVRIHVAGDFFSQDYLDAWISLAQSRPSTLFYAYSKSLPFVVARLGEIPSNLVITASRGGKYDALITTHGLREAVIVLSEQEAADLGLEIDHDDSHAMRSDGKDFALLIHGAQQSGTAAAKAISALRAQGEFGYGRKTNAKRTALRVI